MASGFTVNGVDLDDIFQLRDGTLQYPFSTGFISDGGEDLAQRYRWNNPWNPSYRLSYETGYRFNEQVIPLGVADIREVFRALP